MENFYKFLPVFLWLLYRSYKANKKTQQLPKSSSNQDKRKKSPPKLPSFDEILREMMEGKTEETNSKEIDEEVEVESPNQAFEVPEAEYLEEQDAISENEYRVDTGPTVEEVREDISEIQGVEIDDNQPDSPFDLKSAVIADTILNRPKY
jgi:hypothetical protein